MITGAPLHDTCHRPAASHGEAAVGPGRPQRLSRSRAAHRAWLGPVLINLVAAAVYAALTGGTTGAHVVAACVVALASVAVVLLAPRGAAGRDAEVAALRALLLEARGALAPRAADGVADRRAS